MSSVTLGVEEKIRKSASANTAAAAPAIPRMRGFLIFFLAGGDGWLYCCPAIGDGCVIVVG